MAAPPLTRDRIAALAYQAGFRGQGLANIVAIALAESGGDPQAYNPETAAGTAQGKGSVGLTQIYQTAHPQYGRQDLEDPLTNLQAAYAVSNGGQSFTPWSTWNNGAAQRYLTDETGGLTMGRNQAGDPNQQLIQDAIGDPTTGATAPTTGAMSSTSTESTPPEGGTALSHADLLALFDQHGGVRASGALDPTITGTGGIRSPNPSPKIKYTLKDGTTLTVRFNPDMGGKDGAWDVVDPGTAFKPASAASSRPSGTNTKDRYVFNPTTGQYEDNPNYQQNLVPGDARGGGERDTGTPVDVYNAQTSRQTADTSALNAQTTLGNDTAQRKLDQAKFADVQQQQTVDNALNQAKYQLEVTKNQISLSNLSLSEKQFAYSQAKDKIEQDLARTTQALTQRGQDITTRGQNLSMATQLGSDASQATTAALPYLAPAGTGAALSRAAQQAQSGGTVDATLPTAQFPYNPSDLAWQVTQHALASMPQFGPAAATPAAVPVGGPQFGR